MYRLNRSAHDVITMNKRIFCKICGFEYTEEYDHEACITDDSQECHDNEWEHFNEIDQKANETDPDK